MASGDGSDLIMMFVGENGNPIAGECGTRLDAEMWRADPWLEGFKTGQCFEVKNFRFGAGLNDQDSPLDNPMRRLDQSSLHDTPEGRALKEMIRTKRRGSFDKGPGYRYPVDIKTVTLTKQMDSASVTLFDYCANIRMFKSATLIKRKATGGNASGEVFLRLDFARVLVTCVDWDDDDLVKENITFVCRGVRVNYREQVDPGRLYNRAKSGFFSFIEADANELKQFS